jgi:hypothetical protein
VSYATVLGGLHTVFESVGGIAAVLDYEPTTVQVSPLMYSLLDSVEVTRAGQVMAYRYHIMHRLMVPLQNNPQAEQILIPYVNSIPAAIDADPHLGTVLTNGIATIESIDAVFVTFAGVVFRALNFYSNVLEK